MSALMVDRSVLESFRKRAGLLRPRRPGLDALTRLTLCIMDKITYTNIRMLAYPGCPPGADEIIESMLSLAGGPCSVINPFMNCYLRDYMGFDSTLIAADMGGVMSHTAILVKLNGDNWLVDYGNGHPYLSPICLNKQTEYHHATLFYQVTPAADRANVYQMWHRRQNKKKYIDYTFTLEPREHSYFDQMFVRHYSDPEFSLLLKCLRFVRFPYGEMIAIRDNTLIRTQGGERYERLLTSDDEVIAAVRHNFPLAKYSVKKGLDYLREHHATTQYQRTDV